jgi:hypothetical protein
LLPALAVHLFRGSENRIMQSAFNEDIGNCD